MAPDYAHVRHCEWCESPADRQKSERSSSLFNSGRLQRLSMLDHSFTAQKMAITAPVQTE